MTVMLGRSLHLFEPSFPHPTNELTEGIHSSCKYLLSTCQIPDFVGAGKQMYTASLLQSGGEKDISQKVVQTAHIGYHTLW